MENIAIFCTDGIGYINVTRRLNIRAGGTDSG